MGFQSTIINPWVCFSIINPQSQRGLLMHNEFNQTLRILILEDVPTDAELLEEELRSAGIKFISMRVDNQDSFLEALDRFSPELILSDYSLPAFDGESALSAAREKALAVPFIFVTGALGEDRAVDLLKRGATDFVLKDRLNRIPLCVKRAMEEVEEKRRRQQAEDELQRAHAELEREVEERTAELRQRTLELQQLTGTLEQRVEERTVALERANEALRNLSLRLLSAHEDERKKIAGEIHDTLGACLGAIKFRVENAIQQIGEPAPSTSESLKMITPVIQEGIEECRRIQLDLRPPMLDDLGLLATLSWFCRRFETIYSHIQSEQEIGIAEAEIPAPLKIVIFRVIQEAMNNVAKHSKADRVRLFLRKRDERMELVVQDNGRGFNPEGVLASERTRRGLGLTSMRERVELSGGSFTVESVEGNGTTLRAIWPL
jgi:signal transduction histidine kinase